MNNRVLHFMALSALCISAAAISAVTEDSIVPEADWEVVELPSPTTDTELMADSPKSDLEKGIKDLFKNPAAEVEKALQGLSPAKRQAAENEIRKREQQKTITLDEVTQKKCAVTDKAQSVQTACDTYAATKSEENMHAVLKASFKREGDAAKTCAAWHKRDTTKEALGTPVLNAAAPVMDCFCNDQSTSFEYCALIHQKSFQRTFETFDKTILDHEKTAWLKADTRQEAIANAPFADLLQLFTLETGEELLDHSGQKTGKKKLAFHHLLEQVAPAPLQELLALSAITSTRGKKKPCEGEIYVGMCADSELSRFKPTAQSSQYSVYGASKAVDGNTNTNFGQNSCTHTYDNDHPWWRVDLEATKTVNKVVIWNRGDCCGSRLDGFQVRVGNGASWNQNPRCGSYNNNNIAQGGFGYTTCHKRGRYVHVVVPKTISLVLCEVRVMGPPPPPAPPPPPPISRTLSDGGSCDALSQQSFDPFSKMGKLWKSSVKFQKFAKSLKGLFACNLICDISDYSLGMSCTAKDVAKVDVAWSIADTALKVSLFMCCPGISDVVGEIEKASPFLKKHLNANGIEGGCLVLGRGTLNVNWGTADLVAYPQPVGVSGVRFGYDVGLALNYDPSKARLEKACYYHVQYSGKLTLWGDIRSLMWTLFGFPNSCKAGHQTVDQNWKLVGKIDARIEVGIGGPFWKKVWGDTIRFWFS